VKRLHLHLHGLLSLRLGGGAAGGPRRRAAGGVVQLRGHPGVEGADQPVERRVVDQVVHDVVEGVLDSAQLDFAAGQHAVWQVSQRGGLVEPGVDVRGGAAEGEHLPLDVVGEPLQAGDEAQAGGLELLREGACQGQGAMVDDLRG